MLRDPISIFKAAKIKGVRAGEKAPTTLSLDRYIEHQKVRVQVSDAGHVIDTDIETKMSDFLDARAHQRDDT